MAEENSLLDEIAADAASIAEAPPKESALERISALASRLCKADAEVFALEKQLNDALDKAKDLREREIPDLFAELGLSEVRLSDGSRMAVRQLFAANIKVADRDNAHRWLRENGFGDLIKNEVTVALKRGQDAQAEEVAGFLLEKGLAFTKSESVHPSTLKAFVTERMEKADIALPESISVFPVRRAEIKFKVNHTR